VGAGASERPGRRSGRRGGAARPEAHDAAIPHAEMQHLAAVRVSSASLDLPAGTDPGTAAGRASRAPHRPPLATPDLSWMLCLCPAPGRGGRKIASPGSTCRELRPACGAAKDTLPGAPVLIGDRPLERSRVCGFSYAAWFASGRAARQRHPGLRSCPGSPSRRPG